MGLSSGNAIAASTLRSRATAMPQTLIGVR
jgi:uncharacterized protein YoaH (UPF0181 family)